MRGLTAISHKFLPRKTIMRLSRTLFIASAVALATVSSAAQASAQDNSLSVQIDESRRIEFRGTAGSVIVGNPQIADVTVVDGHTLFVTGKGYGVTEVIAVDGAGRTIFQSQVVVTDGGFGRVRVWRGAQSTEMACAASCAPSVRAAGGGNSAAPTAMP